MASAKECVTTHLPNQSALKMDGTRARGLYSTMNTNILTTLLLKLLNLKYCIIGLNLVPSLGKILTEQYKECVHE